MEPAAPTLLELQRSVRRSLVEHDDREVSPHVIADGMSPTERLDVYRNTCASVLTTALRLSFPAVHRLVGAEFFEGAVRVFIEGHPPKGACLDEYGAEFPGFVADFAPAASLPYLPDVARLEWAVNRALHAPDVNGLDARRLAKLDEADRARVCFTPHPSVGLICAEYSADIIWRSVLEQDDAALAGIDLSAGPVWLLVQRLETGVDVRRMSDAAWRFTVQLCAGRPLHVALEDAREFDAPALLADHLASGRFIGFRLADTSNA